MKMSQKIPSIFRVHVSSSIPQSERKKKKGQIPTTLIYCHVYHHLKLSFPSGDDAKVTGQHQICHYGRCIVLPSLTFFSLQHLSHTTKTTHDVLTLVDKGTRIWRGNLSR
jgi:hypothetical protein